MNAITLAFTLLTLAVFPSLALAAEPDKASPVMTAWSAFAGTFFAGLGTIALRYLKKRGARKSRKIPPRERNSDPDTQESAPPWFLTLLHMVFWYGFLGIPYAIAYGIAGMEGTQPIRGFCYIFGNVVDMLRYVILVVIALRAWDRFHLSKT